MPPCGATPYDVYVYFVSDSNANRGGGYTLTPDGGTPIAQVWQHPGLCRPTTRGPGHRRRYHD